MKDLYTQQLKKIANRYQFLIKENIDCKHYITICFADIEKIIDKNTFMNIYGCGETYEDACKDYIHKLRTCNTLSYKKVQLDNIEVLHDYIDETMPKDQKENSIERWAELISKTMTKIEYIKENQDLCQRKEDTLSGEINGLARALTIMILIEHKGWSDERIIRALKLNTDQT